MKILILGAGQVGRTAADHLSREEANEVTVVDVNEEVLRDLQDRLDVRTVAGNAAHPTVLENAGAAEADIIVALTSSDEVNMMACEVAFTLFRTPTKIARIRAADYTSRAALFGAEGLSVDVFINPEQLVTEYVERLIHHPGTLQVLDFADGKVRLVGVRARRDGLLVGQSLRELKRHLPKVEVRVVAIYRDGRGVAPEGDTVVQEGDEIFFLAARNDIRRVMSELRHADDPARRIVIAGGGNIGFRLAKTLEPHNQVKIIERDARQARRIAELLDNAIVLHGDARQAPGCAQGYRAHQQALVHRAGREQQHRHRHLAADRHHRLAAGVRAPRRRGTRAFPQTRRRRGAGGDRARRRAQLARGRQDGGADPAARRRLHRRGGAG